MNQNKRLAVLTNKDYKNVPHKEIFAEIVKERFDQVTDLPDGINPDDLIYHFKGSNVRKRFHDFGNGIVLFNKVKFGDVKVEKAKNMQIMFKSNLNKLSRGSYKTEDQKSSIKY